jgi:hypothetical protein
MKQLLSTYTFDSVAKTVTLNGINIPVSQVLLIAGKGNVLYSLADGVGAAGYTQGVNSVITLQSVYDLVSLDPLTIYYDDGIDVVNPSTGIQGDDVNVRSVPITTSSATTVGPAVSSDENRTSAQIYANVTATATITSVLQGGITTSALAGTPAGVIHTLPETQPLSQEIRFGISTGTTNALIRQTRKTDAIITTPKAYPNLRLWLDSSDASTMFNAVTGGSNVASGGEVARWEDKSGNNYHAVQSNSALRPNFVEKSRTSPITGISFGGTDYMQFTTGALPSALSTNEFTIFAVVNPNSNFASNYNSVGGTACILSKSAPLSSNLGQWQLDGTSSTGITQGGSFPAFKKLKATSTIETNFGYGATVGNMGHSPVTSSTFDITTCVQFDGSNVNIIKGWDRIDLQKENIAPVVSLTGDFLGFSMAQTIMQGYIKEVIIYDSILTSTQIGSVQRYLTSKWFWVSSDGRKYTPDYTVNI